MDFKEFGNQSGRTLLLLPGTACTWEVNFKNVVDDFAEKYHIIAVNYDGFEGDDLCAALDPAVCYDDGWSFPDATRRRRIHPGQAILLLGTEGGH